MTNSANLIYTHSPLLHSEKYGKILCYPRYDEVELHERIEELRLLGIKSMDFEGSKRIDNVKVLGKGCVGIAVIAYTDESKIALKIRRLDADRENMLHESEMLKFANKLKIGPKLFGLSQNFMSMEYIEGSLLPVWISQNGKKKKLGRLRRIFRNLLLDCFELDIGKLDHGELSNASKHVIVKSNDEPVILDFESSSNCRRPKNVQCMCHYLFIGSKISTEVKKILKIKNIDELIETLKNYKRNSSEECFGHILEVTGLID
ncbi:serine/threonine protein kinase [Candidatus Pacearchaeota archaeon]|nr:serine/threonine protein kinase [Candidatus Pacearchaeota archaeon]